MPSLVAINGPAAGRRYSLGEVAVLGRNPDCQIVIEVGAVSRYHAQISRREGQWWLEDLNSRNGTYWNGQLVTQRTPLRGPGEIRICEMTFRFEPEPGSRETEQFLFLVEALQEQHRIVGGLRSGELQRQLCDQRSLLWQRLTDAFHRVVVLDCEWGLRSGKFDMDSFLLKTWREISQTFDLPFDERIFHPEQISQALKSEQPTLFCVLNVQWLDEQNVHRLRGLGFTQENHPVLYVGDNAFVGAVASPVALATPTDAVEAWLDDVETMMTGSSISMESMMTGSSILVPRRAIADSSAAFKMMENMSEVFLATDDLPILARKVLDRLFNFFPQSDEGFVMLEQEGKLAPLTAKSRLEEDTVMRASRKLVRQVMSTRQALLSADAENDQRFEMRQSIVDFRIRTLMMVPLLDSQGAAMGILQLSTLDQRRRFTQEDLGTLASTVRLMGLAIENRLLRDSAVERKLLEQQLEIAAEVQRAFLPREAPALEGYEFAHRLETADVVGGDLIAYVCPEPHRMIVVLGDVAGRGIPAALIMARLQATLPHHLRRESGLGAALAAANREALTDGGAQRFVTLVLAEIDARAHTLTVANAGHLPPLIRRAHGDIVDIGVAEAGFPLGIVDDAEYQTCQCELAPGDVVCLFTDGVIEAMNPGGDILFGAEGIKRRLELDPLSPQSLIDAVFDDLRRLTQSTKLQDDACLLVCRRVE
jgi:sigma-B regulation protein RsbU (phosphoserine phosphatase)